MEKEDIKKSYKKVFFDTLNKIVAEVLYINRFPEGRTISFKGSEHSKVKNQKFWYEEDSDGNVYFRSNMVPDKPANMYVSDFNNMKLLEEIYDKATLALSEYKKQQEVEEWINNDNLCIYRHGWGWKGAGARKITKEEALKKLPSYSFGNGFYQLGWSNLDGEKALEFNELGENDLW